MVSGLGAPSPPVGTPTRQGALPLDPRTYARALDCVHCGLCLPACPTYTQNGLEADSPRGRIYLMKGLADGRIEPTASVINHLDLCLDCRACETACPSGVVYHELIEETRALLAPLHKPTLVDRVVQAVFLRLFPYPRRLKAALLLPRLLQKVKLWGPITAATRRLLPNQLEKMQAMLPADGPMWERRLHEQYPGKAPPGTASKLRIGVFAGCVGSVLFQPVNRQMIALLQHAGCQVIVPRAQRCCGAIHHHSGAPHEAEAFAKANIDAFLDASGAATVDYIVNNIAGCGAMLRDYAHLLRDDQAYAQKAKDFAGRVRDFSEMWLHLGPAPPPPERAVERTVTYHDACHLAHAQKVTAQPRGVLQQIPGLKLIPLAESDMCCGAAGTYNLQQPAMARDLAQRKLDHIRATGARVCVTGNVGCAMQIQSEAARLGVDLEVVHPVTLLYEAYFGKRPR